MSEQHSRSLHQSPPPKHRRAAALVVLAAVFSVLLAVPSASVHAATVPFRLNNPCPAPPVATVFAHVRQVPASYPTIQAAVNAAQPGDLVSIAPGRYHEAVKVWTPNLTIRGQDRNGVILDGQFATDATNGLLVYADNVVVENMTARDYLSNGFYWHAVVGYRGSYLTAYDNGDYGIYTLHSRCGQFDHSYASGSPDSGFYIGECFPCDAVITHVTSEWNALGYSGTNSGGNLILRDSIWRHNGAGILPNTLDSEKLAPERGTTIVDNLVTDNGEPNVPAFALERPGAGVGIGLPGGNLNYVANNTVARNRAYGILVLPNLDANFWLASGNVVVNNTVSGSGIADVALAAPAGADNCFSGNSGTRTLPPLLQVTHACGSPLAHTGGGDPSIAFRLLQAFVFVQGPNYHGRDFRTVPAPPAQANMPDVNAPPAPALVDALTLTASGLPSGVSTADDDVLVPLGFNGLTISQLLLSFYFNTLFFALYAAWLVIATLDLLARTTLSERTRIGWLLAVLALPILGPLAYYILGRRAKPASQPGAPVSATGRTP